VSNRAAGTVAVIGILLPLVIAACGVSGSVAGRPASVRAATVKAYDDILAFEHSDAAGTFNQESASAVALRDARHTPLEADLAAWVKALDAAGSDDSDAAMQRAGGAAARVSADCGRAGVQTLAANPFPPSGGQAVPSPVPGGLSSVAVISARDAWAAGCSGQTTVLRHWDGSAWRQVSPPAGLACGSTLASPVIVTDSAADTWVFTSADAASFASHWTGMAWTAPVRFAATSTIAAAAACGADQARRFLVP
jgi:hypothetical protein